MKPLRIPRTVTFKGMPQEDKLFVVLLTLVSIALFGYGLYSVGYNGLYILGGAVVLVLVAEMMRKAELRAITDVLENRKSSLPSAAAESFDTKSNLISKVIEKRKQHRHQGLLETVLQGSAARESDEDQARKDHEFLVEMARKKQEAMYSEPGPANPKFNKENFEPAGETYKELMKETIVPQWELGKKDNRKD